MIWFGILFILLLLVVCVCVHLHIDYKNNKCLFGHKWRLKRRYWASSTVLMREYKCKRCNTIIITHYDI